MVSVIRKAMWVANSIVADRAADAKFAEYCRSDEWETLVDAAILTELADWCLSRTTKDSPA